MGRSETLVPSGRLPISSFHARPMISRVLSIAAFLTLASPTLAQGPGSSIPATPSAANAVPGPFGFVRCLTPDLDPNQSMFLPPSDCSANSTNPTSAYDPANLDELVIPVVFHVIRDNNGGGNVPNARVISQVEIFNEDFGALAGTPGAPGVDTKIRFELATSDPQGQASTGIIRYDNSSWFNDNGNYWNSIAWDPNVYLNIYTLGAPSGSSNVLGYVPFFPQTGNAGSAADRVVLLNGTVGRNAPLAPYNQGRTGTHEVGHYLGLYHTFQSGCGGSNCYNSGDRICDTNAESNPEFNCAANSSSCGSTDPVRNYMNYSTDTCMTNFTEEQARRMRCTLEFYRPTLGTPVGPILGANYCVETPNSTGLPATLVGTGTKLIANNDFGIYAQGLPISSPGYFICSPNQAQVPGPGGSQGTLCVGSSTGRYLSQVGNAGIFGIIPLTVDLTAIPQPTGNVAVQPGDTWNFQCWYRDSIFGFPISNFTDGYTITFE